MNEPQAIGGVIPGREEQARSFVKTCSFWRLTANIMGAAHIMLGSAASILMIAVGAKPPLISSIINGCGLQFEDLAFLAAAATALAAFLNAKESSVRHTNGYRTLTTAISQFKSDQSFTLPMLEAARERARRMVQEGGHRD